MNSDSITGKLQNAFGKAEQATGHAIGSQNLENAGAEDRLKGAAKETWGGAKDAVNTVGNHAAAATHDASNNASYEAGRAEGHVESGNASLRDRVVSGAEHLKDSVNRGIDHFKAEHPER